MFGFQTISTKSPIDWNQNVRISDSWDQIPNCLKSECFGFSQLGIWSQLSEIRTFDLVLIVCNLNVWISDNWYQIPDWLKSERSDFRQLEPKRTNCLKFERWIPNSLSVNFSTRRNFKFSPNYSERDNFWFFVFK